MSITGKVRQPEWWEKCWRCGKRRWSKDTMCVHCGAQP